MPRKQRFKPSRKPKPAPPNEEAVIGRQTHGGSAHNDNLDVREVTQARDEERSSEPESEHGSR